LKLAGGPHTTRGSPAVSTGLVNGFFKARIQLTGAADPQHTVNKLVPATSLLWAL